MRDEPDLRIAGACRPFAIRTPARLLAQDLGRDHHRLSLVRYLMRGAAHLQYAPVDMRDDL